MSLRPNNAADAFNSALACTVVQADRPHVGRFLEELRLQKNAKCVAPKTVSAQRPIAERELSGLSEGLRKNVEKRQDDRNARHATIAARFAEDGDIAMLLRGLAHNYMRAKFKTLQKGGEVRWFCEIVFFGLVECGSRFYWELGIRRTLVIQ